MRHAIRCLVLFLGIFWLASALDPASLAPYTAGQTTLDWLVTPDGRNRTFRVYVPSTVDSAAPSPLLLFFHGGLGSALQAQTSYGMDAVASRERFVVAYPDGFSATWNGGLCCGQAALQNVDDVLFASLVVDRVAARAPVDASRVYSTGMSNGAVMSHRLACELSSRVAAVAAVEGSLMVASVPCAPQTPVGVLEIHGTFDENIPWAGGRGCGLSAANWRSVPQTMSSWTSSLSCSCAATAATAFPGCEANDTALSQGDGACVAYGACNGGALVELCYGPWAHTWGGSAGSKLPIGQCNSTTSSTFIASEVVWKFVSRFRRALENSSHSGTGGASSSGASQSMGQFLSGSAAVLSVPAVAAAILLSLAM
eukprot:m51a1_g9607 hypothetical protein (369) ;mRNA; f:1064056-1065162